MKRGHSRAALCLVRVAGRELLERSCRRGSEDVTAGRVNPKLFLMMMARALYLVHLLKEKCSFHKETFSLQVFNFNEKCGGDFWGWGKRQSLPLLECSSGAVSQVAHFCPWSWHSSSCLEPSFPWCPALSATGLWSIQPSTWLIIAVIFKLDEFLITLKGRPVLNWMLAILLPRVISHGFTQKEIIDVHVEWKHFSAIMVWKHIHLFILSELGLAVLLAQKKK